MSAVEACTTQACVTRRGRRPTAADMPVSRTIDPRSMLTSLARPCSAVLTVASIISRPLPLWMAARKRRTGAWRRRPPTRGHEVPVDQLRHALGDFEARVRNWSSPSLADLRSRMAVMLADRSSAASVWIAANSVSHVGRRGPASMAGRLASHAGAVFRSSRPLSGRTLSARRVSRLVIAASTRQARPPEVAELSLAASAGDAHAVSQRPPKEGLRA